jgi:ferric iron reductase protein FhuF
MDPLTKITEAKDGYQLALIILSLSLVAIAYLVKQKDKQDAEDTKTAFDVETAHTLRIDAITTAFIADIKATNRENNDRIERLIEAHNRETVTAIQSNTKILTDLHRAIEKRQCDTLKLLEDKR